MIFIKRALLYITRKKNKSIILFLTLWLIITGLLVGISVGRAGNKAKQVFSDKSAYTLRISNNHTQLVGDGYGSGEIPETVIKNLSDHSSVEKTNNHMVAFSSLFKHEIVRKGASKEEYRDNIVTVNGNTYSELDSKFTAGMIRLTEGRHITKDDKYVVLVHEEFAKINKVKVGDILPISSDYIRNPQNKGEVNVKIIGIFKGQTESKSDYPYEMLENFFFGDEQLTRDLYGYKEGKAYYAETTFQLKKGAQIEPLKNLIEQQKIDWSKYEVTSKDHSLQTYEKSIDILNELSKQLITGLIVVSVVLALLTLFSWVGDRTHEMGILLALGKSKINIISQFAIEVVLIAFLSFSLSFVSGNFLGQKVGDALVYQAARSARADITNNMGGMNLGADPETDMLMQAIKKIDVAVISQDMFTVLMIGSGIILFSIIGSSLIVLRYNPKEILSKIS